MTMNFKIKTALAAVTCVSTLLGSNLIAEAHDPNETSEEIKAKATTRSAIRTNSKAAIAEGKSRGSVARSNGRIINGLTLTDLSDNWRWTVSLQELDNEGDEKGRHFCGGTFIAPTLSGNGRVIGWNDNEKSPIWVLTAAHCITAYQKSLINEGKMLASSGATKQDNLIGQKVVQYFVHKDFNDDSLANDIAVLKLEPRTDVTPSRTSIRLADSSSQPWLYQPFTALDVMGWGTTAQGALASQLQRVRVPYVDNATCQNSYSAAANSDSILPGMICAGYSSGGFDSCQGDSGGPLVHIPAPDVDGPSRKPILGGIVSWGRGCALPNLFGVYTSVLAFRPWLDQTVTDALDNN